MITISGQKMGKSLKNFITLNDFFTGNSELLSQAYSPMTIRFFILQAHYRSTLDFSDAALQSAEKGMTKLLNTFDIINKISPAHTSSIEVKQFENKFYDAMNDDFNTPIAIAHLFDLSKLINQVNDGKETLSKEDLTFVKNIFNVFVTDLLGLKNEINTNNDQLVNELMDTILVIRNDAKQNKDWATADRIRNELDKINIKIKDTKDGAKWSFK
jgi:cysteinyl-tRNA synthetase